MRFPAGSFRVGHLAAVVFFVADFVSISRAVEPAATVVEPIRQIWMGKALPAQTGWLQREGGVRPGKNPSPYVFPLGKEYPAGKYKIWLNPFNRARTPIKITLSGESQMLKTDSFHGGWYGGNVLDAPTPFSAITLEFGEGKKGLDGIALSSNPRDGFQRGEILKEEALAGQGSKGAKNLFYGSSFETGSGFGYATHIRPDALVGKAWNGEKCLQTKVIATRWLQLTPDLPHVWSAWIKMDKPGNMGISIQGATGSSIHGKTEKSLTYAKSVAITQADTWQRVSMEFTPAVVLGNLYQVIVRAGGKDNFQTFCIDGIQLEQSATLSSYQPQHPIEFGFFSHELGQVFIQGQPAALDILAFNSADAPAEAQLTQVTYDFEGAVIEKRPFTWKLPKGGSRSDWKMTPEKTGLFRTELLDDKGKVLDELVYSVLPPRPFGKAVHYPEDSTLGTDTSPDFYPYLFRANRHWAITKHASQYPLGGSYNTKIGITPEDWSKAETFLEQVKNSPVQTLCTVATYSKFDVSKDTPVDYGSYENFLKAYAKYIEHVAREYGKAGVTHFEIWNEPYGYGGYKPDTYFQLLKAAYPAVKAGNPKATVVGICGQEKWTSDILALGARDYCDVISNHYYGNDLASMRAYGELAKKYKVNTWTTETSGATYSSYRTMPTPESVFETDRKAHFDKIQRGVNIPAGIGRLKNYLYNLTLCRATRYFSYFSRFGGTLADLHDSARGNTEWDGGWKVSGTLQNIASFFMDGHRFDQELVFAPEIESFHLISKAKENLLLLWVRENDAWQLTLPPALLEKAHLHDMLGNEIPLKGEIALETRPLYLRSDLEPGVFAGLVKQIKAVRTKVGEGSKQEADAPLETAEMANFANIKQDGIMLVPDRSRVTRENFRSGFNNISSAHGANDLNGWIKISHDGAHLILRARVEDETVLPPTTKDFQLKTPGDHVRFSFIGKDGVMRYVALAPDTQNGAQAWLFTKGTVATPLSAKGRMLNNAYEIEARVSFKDLGIDPAPGIGIPMDIALEDSDTSPDSVDSEFVWSGFEQDPAEPKGLGVLKLEP